GGYGGGSGYRGDGDAEVIFQLILWCFRHPGVGLPLLGVVSVVVIIHMSSQGSQRFGSGAALPRRRRSRRRGDDLDLGAGLDPGARSPWKALAAKDPTFSRVVLIDFLTRLVVRFHQAQGEGDPDELQPYLAPKVLEALRAA